jgi:hypothetical protein
MKPCSFLMFFCITPLFLASSCSSNSLQQTSGSSATSGQKLVNLFVGSDGYQHISFLSCVGGLDNIITEEQLNEYLGKGGRVIQTSDYQTVGVQSRLGDQRCTSRPTLVVGKINALEELISINKSSYEYEVDRLQTERQAQFERQKKLEQEFYEKQKQEAAEEERKANEANAQMMRELDSAL